MKRHYFILVSLLFLCSCTTTNVFNIRDEDAAILKNHNHREIDNGRISYFFSSIDGKKLGVGPFDSRTRVSYLAPEGKRVIGIELVFSPKISAFSFRPSMYQMRGTVPVELHKGKTYRINASLEGAKFLAWIETPDGMIVSETIEVEPAIINPGMGPLADALQKAVADDIETYGYVMHPAPPHKIGARHQKGTGRDTP